MEQQMHPEEETLKVSLVGQFTFNDNNKFRQVIDAVKNGDHRSVTIDFSQVDFIDSAALGMLLLLRDLCQGKQIDVVLQAANGQVLRIFNISRFDKLFTIR